WALTVVSGAPSLRAIEMVNAQVGYVVGASGTILKTVDGGGSWQGQSSGTVATLNAVRFVDEQDGWAVGDGGTALSTTDGGSSWLPVGLVTPNALLAVDGRGGGVWIVGAEGT